MYADRTDSSLCRSQSSSLSSLDGPVSKEAVQCLCFAETYARKSGMIHLHSKSFVTKLKKGKKVKVRGFI